MSVSTSGTLPETRPLDPADDRPGPTDGPSPTGADPSAPSAEDIVGEARRVAQGEGGASVTDPGFREAVRASEASDGAQATVDRIRDGSLLSPDGTALMGAAGPDDRARVADEYLSDLRARAAAVAGALGADGERLAYQTDLVRGHLGEFYQDPDAALDRLHALDGDQRAALSAGDASVLGDLRDDAAPGGPRTDALSAHRDVHDLHPDQAAMVREAREQARAETLLDDLGPDDGRPEQNAPDRGQNPDSPAGPTSPGNASVTPKGLGDSMEQSVITRAMSLHEI